MQRILVFLATLAVLATAASAQGQCQCRGQAPHPISGTNRCCVTVTIANLAGRDLLLEDGESQWFGFTVLRAIRKQ
jgi:hypothetical protein